jgi:hypothetical protein
LNKTIISKRTTTESNSFIAPDSTGMSEEQDRSPDVQIPKDEEEVIEMSEAETEQQKNLAIAQAKLIGDL